MLKIKKQLIDYILCLLLLTSTTAINAQVCGNGICEEGENISNCPDDCFVSGFTGNNFGGDLLWYGVHEWKTNLETLNAFHNIFTDVGKEIARFDIYWGKLEPAKGIYDWTLTDELLSTISDDTPVLFTIFSTSKWGSKYNNVREFISQYYGNEDDPQIYNRPPSSIPINMQDYMDFLEVLVNKYGDRVKYWMIDNEVHSATDPYEWDTGFQLPPDMPLISRFWIGTPEEYVDLLQNSYSKIKQIDSTMTVMASNFMKHETNEVFTNHILENCGVYTDVLALNFYRCPKDDIDRIIEMKAKMNSFGYDKPIWVTEHGEIDIACHTEAIFQESFNSPEELKLQAEEIVKRYVLAFSAGVKKMFRLTLNHQNEEWNATSKYLHMGLTFDKAGNEKKPGYYTNKLLIEKLKNFRSVEKIDYGIYRFNFLSKAPVYILWNNGNATIDLSTHISTSNAKKTHIITGLDENNFPIYLADEIVSVDSIVIDETPVFIEESQASGITKPEKILSGFEILQNYPNPFNSQTTISYQLPVFSKVSLKIYNMLGQEVRTLVSENKATGEYSVVWNGKDNSGKQVSPGGYFYSLKLDNNYSITNRMLLMK